MDTAFFIASRLIGALLRPDTWIIIVLAIVVLALTRSGDVWRFGSGA